MAKVLAALALLASPSAALVASPGLRVRAPDVRRQCVPLASASEEGALAKLMSPFAKKAAPAAEVAKAEDEGEWTIEKVASLGLAGVLSIAVAETVFWVLSFPASELLYYFSTGEWIDLLTQEGQIKFLAFSAGWGALGGVVAQYRTVLTAAAMTPWMDRTVVKPYLQPMLDQWAKKE